jgi:calcium-dependent protein kinase
MEAALSTEPFGHLIAPPSEFHLLDFIQQGLVQYQFPWPFPAHLCLLPPPNSVFSPGGSGKVYSGYWKKKKMKVALKFFGYSITEPNVNDILNEIRILQQLRHLSGFVQLQAVFMDTMLGKAENKIHSVPYPCIVMELLEGKELIEVIEQHQHISEHDLATIFRQLIHTLSQCHDLGFIHRWVSLSLPSVSLSLLISDSDLKLQNLMFADKDSFTSCKIIDCGMMIHLSPPSPSSPSPSPPSVYTSTKIQGTMGYVAPESLLKKQYSAASDVWQAGVCLYSLLSGSYPFNPRYPEHVVERGYVPMVGLGWKNISDNAKDLIAKMLIKNPSDRITVTQIFQHPCTHPPPLCVLWTLAG